MATGGGFVTRELYTDREEALFNAARPMIMDGIEPLAEKPDLADRSLLLELPCIPPDRRLSEEEFWSRFEGARPRILGAALDAVSTALRNVGTVKLDSKPRMADFAVWSVAAEPALPWGGGAFMKAYEANRVDMVHATLEGDILPDLLVKYLQEIDVLKNARITEFKGTAGDLYQQLNLTFAAGTPRPPDWPKSTAQLSKRLRRLAPALRTIGIGLTFPRSNGKRLIEIKLLSERAIFTDPTGPVSKPTVQPAVN